MIEPLGYLASVVIVISLSMSSVIRFRIVGLIGAVMFGIYGALVGSIPVVATNVVIIGLHGFFLRRAFTDDEYFTLLEVQSDSPYLLQFLDFHGTDIRKAQPEFEYDPDGEHHVVFVLRDMVPAGVFIAADAVDGVMDVELDYVIPRYRDLRPACFLFDTSKGAFAEWGAQRLSTTATTKIHRDYLEKVGFVPVDTDRFELDLAKPPAFKGWRGAGMRRSGRE